MGASKSKSVLLKKQLLLFFDVLALYVSVGYDLFYAWNEAVDSSELFVRPEAHQSMNTVLEELENSFPLKNYRFTFGVLRQLYSRGATLTPAIHAFSKTLRRDLEREFEAHLRTAPLRANLCLLLFFLPPALGFIAFPFLQHLRQVLFKF
jgi:hypothetical protein